MTRIAAFLPSPSFQVCFSATRVLAGIAFNACPIFYPPGMSRDSICNRNPETRQKLCGAVRWYRAAVVWRLWRRRLIPETQAQSPVATHLSTSLNLPVSSLAPDSNWIPITVSKLESRQSGCGSLSSSFRLWCAPRLGQLNEEAEPVYVTAAMLKLFFGGLYEHVTVHTKLPPILQTELGGKPKWLPLHFIYDDAMHTHPIATHPILPFLDNLVNVPLCFRLKGFIFLPTKN